MRQFHPRRAAGTSSNSATAAIADRKQATCHAVNDEALIAAPPVENSAAAARIAKRAPWNEGI